MKAVEFTAVVNADRTIVVPPSLADAVWAGQTVRVLVLVADEGADRDWEAAAVREFGLGYADSDAIYDQLSAG